MSNILNGGITIKENEKKKDRWSVAATPSSGFTPSGDAGAGALQCRRGGGVSGCDNRYSTPIASIPTTPKSHHAGAAPAAVWQVGIDCRRRLGWGGGGGSRAPVFQHACAHAGRLRHTKPRNRRAMAPSIQLGGGSLFILVLFLMQDQFVNCYCYVEVS